MLFLNARIDLRKNLTTLFIQFGKRKDHTVPSKRLNYESARPVNVVVGGDS